MGICIYFFFYFQVCKDCPAGKECKRTDMEGTDCPAGTFSLGKQKACSICPSGYKCPVKDKAPQICEENTYRYKWSVNLNVSENSLRLYQDLVVIDCSAGTWKVVEKVTRGHNIVTDGWAGASNPHPHPNLPQTLKHTQKYQKRLFSHVSTRSP